jgi:Spy/CpxP family protein refolding chaperone
MGSCTFLPPGKVCDYFGFQYMRDIDESEKGHNTSFLTKIANNMLHVLTDGQKAQLVALAKEQVERIDELAYKRFPLIRAFWRQRDGDIPEGGKGLDRDAVMKYSAGIWELDGSLAYQRAKACGAIIRSLTDEQKTALARLKFGDSSTWPELEDQIDKRGMSHEVHVAVMTYASEMFSWYAGSVEADTYFCPERHATYFGSFYMKDIPVMGKKNASISTSLTGDSGEAFLNLLTEPQRKLITDMIDAQRDDLQEIVKTRRAISLEFRRFMKDDAANEETVLVLSRRYGELDGKLSYNCATRFAEINKTLSDEQKAKLLKLRNLDDYPCKGAYIYSRAIAMPEMANTDFLFGVPEK